MIVKRAAWLDHEIKWIDMPSIFELHRLGLEDADVVLLENQVTIEVDSANAGVITVRNVKIETMDEKNRQLSYRVLGSVNLLQGWDRGGAYLVRKEDQYGWSLD